MIYPTMRVVLAMLASGGLYIGGYLIEHTYLYPGMIAGTLGAFVMGVLAASGPKGR